MAEALFNASGLGLPIVMTVANRAIGAPINIWNDHSDAMSMRDSGWIQLYAESNQEAVDLIKLGKPGEEYLIDLDYCKGCGLCVAECPSGAIQMFPEEI